MVTIVTPPTRIGIFGGTFDPVHIGHFVAAIHARYVCTLDKVLMVVADQPWQKAEERPITPAELRFRAVSAAAEAVEGIEASRIEIDRGGPSYTVDTLRDLRNENPGAKYFLIVGADTAAKLDTWRDSADIAAMAELVIVNRPGATIRSLASFWRPHIVHIPPLDISSTDLRDRLVDGRPVDFLIPSAAIDVLRAC